MLTHATLPTSGLGVTYLVRRRACLGNTELDGFPGRMSELSVQAQAKAVTEQPDTASPSVIPLQPDAAS